MGWNAEAGVYLGNCMGLGFWSKLDPVGQDVAVTFATPEALAAHVATWDSPMQGGVWPVAVEPSGGIYATIDDCFHVGLETWDPNGPVDHAASHPLTPSGVHGTVPERE